MTPKNIAIIACRLLAIWFFVESTRDSVAAVANGMQLVASRNANRATGFLSVFPNTQTPLSCQDILSLAAFPLVHFCAAVILYLGASVLGESMTRGMKTDDLNREKLTLKSWQTLGFSLLGLFLCAQGVSFLSGQFCSMIYVGANPYYQTYQNLDSAAMVARITTAAIQCATGWILLFKAQSTAQFLSF